MSTLEQQDKPKNYGMRILLVVIGIILALGLTIGVTVVMAYFGAATKGNESENKINQLSQSSASTLSNLASSIKEMAQVPDMATDQLKQLIKEQMSGRYGPDGSKAVFQFLKEQNLQVDQRMYLNIQAEMSAGRKEFKITQDRLLTSCNSYKNELGNPWSGLWLRVAGYPKADLTVVCRAVTDVTTDKAFATGHQTPISLK